MLQQAQHLPQPLPGGFTYLHEIDPTILQDVKYAGYHNFVGRPIRGYQAPVIIMTEVAAFALKDIQEELRPFNLTLKVYDAYRPQDAVDSWIEWAKDHTDQDMKAEFYPDINKEDLFDSGYISSRSTHTRGSTVDLTIVPLPVPPQPIWKPGEPLLDGRLPQGKRYPDNSIDMGTSFDCFDELSHPLNPNLPAEVRANRMLLASLMKKHGFRGITTEWWHFTLINEPFPETYFNFPVA